MKNGYWYLVKRIDGKELGVAETRHEAVGMIPRAHANKNEWLDIVPITPTLPDNWTPRMTVDFDNHPERWDV